MRKQAIWLAPLLWCCVLFSSALADEWRFSGVKRIVALSDIHGAYDAFVATLQKSGVIDDSLVWSGGKTHLVITGDVLDRGPESRRAMDLIIRLEREAPIAGGRVHQLLGNHEVMNLTGDLRYVSDEEYAAFLDIESVEEREHWYQRFRDSKPADSDESAIRWEFDEKAPPGYFGHRRAFRHDGMYGKWLLKKPLMIVINDTAFVHGGVPPYVSDHGLTGVNIALKKDLHDYVVTRAMLQDAAVMSPIEKFKEIPSSLSEKMAAGQIADKYMSAAQDVVDLSTSPLHLPAGPTWYRGTATCSRLIEGDELNAALNEIGAHRVVIGHTPTITRRVQQRMNGRIVEIDTGMLQSHYDGIGNALIIEGDKLSVVNQDGQTDLWPIPHPVRVGHESMAVDDYALASILENGIVDELNTVTAARRLVRVTADKQSVFAYFSELPRDLGFAPELAAFKLDRLLGLGMVPVTVRRKIAGLDGTLQFVPPETRTERERVADGEEDKAPCPLEKQMGAMFVFDSLIYNAARTPSTMLYSADDWLLMLVDNENSFDAVQGRPAYLKDIGLTIGEQWRTALLEIDDETLGTNLGEVLDKRRLAALAKRRDALIEESYR
jgi:Calcineurin-like phosphoesterase